MARIAAVLFDMDGVLVDSEPIHARSWQMLLQEFRVHFRLEWFDGWVGVTDLTLAQYLCEHYEIPLSPDDFVRRKREVYRQIADHELQTFPGVDDGISRIEERLGTPAPLAVVTSSTHQEAIQTLTTVGLLEHFAAIVGSDDVQAHKPEPEPYLKAAALLGIPAPECAVIEDSSAGVAAGRAAGCTVIAVRTTHPAEKLAAADRICASTAEALTYMLKHAL